MKRLLMLVIGMVFLVGIASPAWAPLVTKVDNPKPQAQSQTQSQPKSSDPNVVDLSDKKSQVPRIPPTPPPAPKAEKQSPKK